MPDATELISGRCYCEEVRFTVAADADVLLSGYCQCQDCRRAHAATLYHYGYVRESAFEVTGGAAHIQKFVRDKAIEPFFHRAFCTQCGTRVYNFCIVEFSGQPERLIGLFPALFDDFEFDRYPTWQPREHINAPESQLDLSLLHDGLPRFPGRPERDAPG